MSYETAFVIAALAKYTAVIATVVGVVYLASQGKNGWGWLIFLAVILACTSYETTGILTVK